LINVATEIIMHLYLDRRPKHLLQIILLDIRTHQIILSLIEVLHLPLTHIRTMVPDMVLVVLPTHLHPGRPTFILSLSVDHMPCQGQCPLIRIDLLVRRITVIDHPSLRLFIIIKDIMDTILVEPIIITIKVDHRCPLIFLRVLLHLWELVITIAIATVIGITEEGEEEGEEDTITEDRTLLVVATGGDEIPSKYFELAGNM